MFTIVAAGHQPHARRRSRCQPSCQIQLPAVTESFPCFVPNRWRWVIGAKWLEPSVEQVCHAVIQICDSGSGYCRLTYQRVIGWPSRGLHPES